MSSRSNRKNNDDRTMEQRAQDFMDEEDLADAAEAQHLQTSDAFAGLGASTQDSRGGGLAGLFRADGNTMGLKLLRRMGWKDGQGIGPKVRRAARLESNTSMAEETMHLFAPDDVAMIGFVRKTDRMGLGHRGEVKLQSKSGNATDDDDQDDHHFGTRKPSQPTSKSKPSTSRSGMGMGILNDTGSDDEDPYEMGPKIKYNRVLGGDKKKKKKNAAAAANPSLGKTPVFIPKTARAGGSLRRCHDGRLPLDGFVLANAIEDLTAMLAKYAPPSVPDGWVSAIGKPSATTGDGQYLSTADAAKASTMDPKSRAALLGEKALPGKSVFDFLSSAARDKLAAGSGKSNLPPGLGEVPEGYTVSEEERMQALWNQVPKLDRDTAIAAISRSSKGPYADNEAKRERYQLYLESGVNPDRPLPGKAPGMTDDDYLREMNEFHNCARIFKPMTGFMASRFTTAKSSPTPGSDANAGEELLSKPEPKQSDPAEEAAKMGMYGKMTRTVEDFYPTRLLCKRFNVKPPEHSKPDYDQDVANARAESTVPLMITSGGGEGSAGDNSSGMPRGDTDARDAKIQPEVVNAERNEAVEGKTASEDLLKAVFGDSDDED